MTAVIYARYSSDNQREESIEGQIRECTAYAEKNGITIVKHYIDRAISAKTDNRPEFQRMIQDSREKLFDIVLVWKLDRFARNRYDSAQYKNILKKNGVRVVSANEAISDSSEGILMESILEGFAEYFSADLAEKVDGIPAFCNDGDDVICRKFKITVWNDDFLTVSCNRADQNIIAVQGCVEFGKFQAA